MAKKDSNRPKFDAALTDEMVEKGERAAKSYGVTRRVAYSTLTRSSDELCSSKWDEETADAFLEAVESMGKYLAWIESEKQLMEAARARVLTVLQWQVDHGALRDLAHT